MTHDELRQRVFSNPANTSIIDFLGLAKQGKLAPWKDSPYDEGAKLFFLEHGSALPPDSRYSTGIANLLICPVNGTIFAAHFGRCVFLVRPDYRRQGLNRDIMPTTLQTLDGYVDITFLGKDWTFLFLVADEGDEKKCFRNAYEHAQTASPRKSYPMS
jgi:hypothetical protein